MAFRTLLTFHPKVKKLLKDFLAGLLALHIADAFPFNPGHPGNTVAIDSQQQNVNYSCGDSSGINQYFTGIPF